MNTIDRLQKHLANEIIKTSTGLYYKPVADLVKCAMEQLCLFKPVSITTAHPEITKGHTPL